MHLLRLFILASSPVLGVDHPTTMACRRDLSSVLRKIKGLSRGLREPATDIADLRILRTSKSEPWSGRVEKRARNILKDVQSDWNAVESVLDQSYDTALRVDGD
jgi:hypothetical protein